MGNTASAPALGPSSSFPGTFIANMSEDKQLEDYPTLASIKARFGLTARNEKGKGTSGTFNTVQIYNIEPEKGEEKYALALRMAKEPTFKLTGKVGKAGQGGELTSASNVSLKDVMLDQVQSYRNWKAVNSLNLCPKVFFYGFVRKKDERLFLCQVSEAYDTSLYGFYSKAPVAGKDNVLAGAPSIARYAHRGAGELRSIDVTIAGQLNRELAAIGDSLGLICFDIKPDNAVIKIGKTPRIAFGEGDPVVTVKLIDWDGDWCIPFTMLLKNETPETKKLIGIINQIIMANHFLLNFNWNIFSEYFKGLFTPDYTTSNKARLKELFCEEVPQVVAAATAAAAAAGIKTLKPTRRHRFDFFSTFYLFDGNKYSCSEMFDKMWDNCQVLQVLGGSSTSFVIPKSPILPTPFASAPAAAHASPPTPHGGGRRKACRTRKKRGVRSIRKKTRGKMRRKNGIR